MFLFRSTTVCTGTSLIRNCPQVYIGRDPYEGEETEEVLRLVADEVSPINQSVFLWAGYPCTHYSVSTRPLCTERGGGGAGGG